MWVLAVVLVGVALGAGAVRARVPEVEPPGRQHWTLLRRTWPGDDPLSRARRHQEALRLAALARMQQALRRIEGSLLLSAERGGEARFLEERVEGMGPLICSPPREAPRELYLERIRVEFLDRRPDPLVQLRHLVRLVEREIARLAAGGGPAERLGVFRVLLGDLQRLERKMASLRELPPCPTGGG